MNFAALIEQAANTFDREFTLAELLDRCDALNKLVPTLAELNGAFAEIARGGRLPARDWRPVNARAYEEALAENRERTTRLMESQGISRERQQQILKDHARRFQRGTDADK